MIKSPKFTHSKKDNNKAQGRSAHLTAIVVSLVLSIIMITISVFNVSAVVIDVSSHDGLIDSPAAACGWMSLLPTSRSTPFTAITQESGPNRERPASPTRRSCWGRAAL